MAKLPQVWKSLIVMQKLKSKCSVAHNSHSWPSVFGRLRRSQLTNCDIRSWSQWAFLYPNGRKFVQNTFRDTFTSHKPWLTNDLHLSISSFSLTSHELQLTFGFNSYRDVGYISCIVEKHYRIFSEDQSVLNNPKCKRWMIILNVLKSHC